MENAAQFENTENPDILELKNISQTYDGGKTWVIKDLNLLVENREGRGQCIVILGRSGCGKSTILRYLCGLQQPTTGEVFIKEQPRTDADRIGMIFQRYSSLPWFTVLQNVELGLEFQGVSSQERRERARDIISTVGLDGHEHKFAQHPALSGGQLQRVAIARSLVCNPEVLLMDEPFGALDIDTRLSMQDFLVRIWETFKNTILFVTHDIPEAVYLADQIWIMDSNPGRIAHRIDISELLPYQRTRKIKREKRFVDIVYDIEDKMTELAKRVHEEKPAVQKSQRLEVGSTIN